MTLESKSQQKSKKELWEEKKREVAKRLDRIGGEMDPGIVETVAVLNILGIPTSGSCEGHLDHGHATTWVHVQAENRPKERFLNEGSIRASIAEEFGISPEKIDRGINPKADRKFWDTVQDAEETSEYKAWREKNNELVRNLISWIKEFYNNTESNEQTVVNMRKVGGLAGIIQSGPDEETPEDMDDTERETLAQKLRARQAEMRKFTDFLRKKYLGDKMA